MAEDLRGLLEANRRWAEDAVGRELNLRGINAKVVKPGTIRVGDPVTKTL